MTRWRAVPKLEPIFILVNQLVRTMNIAVIGSGGVGGFYDLKLVQAGHDVTFVARGAHLKAMREAGLPIENESGVIASLHRADARARG